MNSLGNMIGELCKVILPIPEESYQGNPDSTIAVCTLSSLELQRTTNWKWWKTPTPFNEADAREELIDIWHFVVQASLELNLTPDDIVEEYKKKNEINRERQKTGY